MGASESSALGDNQHPTTRIALACAIIGIVVAVALVLVADSVFASGAGINAHVQTLLAYGATWAPMLAAVIVFGLVRRGRGAQAVLGIRFRPIDLLWGAAIGVLGRFVGAGINLLLYGTTGLVGQPLIGSIGGWYVFGALIAPVVIAPLIEETFFRGLMQGALVRRYGGGAPDAAGSRSGSGSGSGAAGSGSGRTAAVLGVALTVLIFTAVHLIGVPSASAALSVGVPLVVFAVAAGVARQLTGRIGAAVVGHIVFNGIAVLLTWPW